MPRPRIPLEVQNRIRALRAEKLSVPEIAERISEEGDFDVSERTVRRYVEEFDRLSAEEQREYSLVRWPENLGDLPWEAATSILELLRVMNETGAGRPTVRIARWCWRVWQAAPDIPRPTLVSLGGLLATLEQVERFLPGQDAKRVREGLEWYMAYAPWRDAGTEWLARLKSGTIPSPFGAAMALVVKGEVPLDIAAFLVEEIEPLWRAAVADVEAATGLSFEEILKQASNICPALDSEEIRQALWVVRQLKALGRKKVLEHIRKLRNTTGAMSGGETTSKEERR